MTMTQYLAQNFLMNVKKARFGKKKEIKRDESRTFLFLEGINKKEVASLTRNDLFDINLFYFYLFSEAGNTTLNASLLLP